MKIKHLNEQQKFQAHSDKAAALHQKSEELKSEIADLHTRLAGSTDESTQAAAGPHVHQ